MVATTRVWVANADAMVRLPELKSGAAARQMLGVRRTRPQPAAAIGAIAPQQEREVLAGVHP